MDLATGRRLLVAKQADGPSVSGSTVVWMGWGTKTAQGHENPIMVATLPRGAARQVAVGINPSQLTIGGPLVGWLERQRLPSSPSQSGSIVLSDPRLGRVYDLKSGRQWRFGTVGWQGRGRLEELRIVGRSVIWLQMLETDAGGSEIWSEDLDTGQLRKLDSAGGLLGLLSPLGSSARWSGPNDSGTATVYGCRLPAGPVITLLSGDPQALESAGPSGGGNWAVWSASNGGPWWLVVRRLAVR